MKKIFILIILPILFQSFTFISADADIIQLAHKMQVKYKVPNKKYVTIIDYRKSILSTRLYLVDMEKNQIVIRSTVAHAFKSGLLFASKFSNDFNSDISSIGAFETKGTYFGDYGYSLKINGLDKGINSNALARKIIFHSTKNMHGIYSFGCFATPVAINQQLIDKIKGGTLVYVYR
jgi:L,D-transpeptidase catalytic domain